MRGQRYPSQRDEVNYRYAHSPSNYLIIPLPIKRQVPSAVPGIAFLSGGQSSAEATEHLSLMNQMAPLPWALTFSYGRALQDEALRAWSGKPETFASGQQAFLRRARLVGLAQ